MPVELECKVRVSSLAEVRETLRAAGAEYLGRGLETNRLFDREDSALRDSGCGLRIRSVTAEDGPSILATLTFKGPRQPGPFKCREELEVTLGDPAAMAAILRSLGYGERILFEKRRETWLLASCRVELDELPVLGTFVEIEGPDGATIQQVRQQIGLADQEALSQSYVSMVAEVGEGRPGGLISLCFSS